tara:strand:- start:559 stop:795 length:237 start_codon:yes stop_codon:yes gene_type:complete
MYKQAIKKMWNEACESDYIFIEIDKNDVEILKTIIFEFCDKLDDRKGKDGNYKDKIWHDCLEFRDRFIPELNKEIERL